jgi:HEAT repeat protein
MKRRSVIRITLASCLLLGGLAALMWQPKSGPPEPVFQGKPLTFWLEDLYRMTAPRNYSISLGGPGARAVRELGTNAVPYLIHMITVNQERLSDKPEMLAKNARLLSTNCTTAQENLARAVNACQVLGPKAKAAIPTLLPLLEDQNSEVRVATVTALCFIQQDAEIVGPRLVERLADPDYRVRDTATRGLLMFRELGASAKPELQKLTESTNASIRATATNLLRRIEQAPPK